MSDDEFDELTAEDRAALGKISEAEDPREFARHLFAYYHDNARARRTSRSIMYLHLGMASGMIERAAARGDDPALAAVLAHERDGVLALYRTMPANELRALHAAFVADRQSARVRGDRPCIAFCDRRIAVIDHVQRERGEV